VGGGYGQTAKRQFDGLANLGKALGEALDQPVEALWEMQNGYALCTRAGLDAIAEHLGALQPKQVDILRGKLCIGIIGRGFLQVTFVSIGNIFVTC
jgi:hypothetical protein